MSKGLNRAILIGNVGEEPTIRLFGNDKNASFSVATSTGGYKKQDGAEIPEKTLWHRITAWRGLAEITEKYIHKGDKVCVTGSLNYNTVEQNGVKRTFTDIIASDIVLLGGKKDAGGDEELLDNVQNCKPSVQKTDPFEDVVKDISNKRNIDDLPFLKKSPGF